VNHRRLADWLASKLGAAAVEVANVRRHTEGFSWETYTLDATIDGTARGLAMRVEPADGLLAPYDIDAQYRLHEVVHRHSGVPVAAPLWLEHDTGVIGRPFYVMERVEGEVPVQWNGGAGVLGSAAGRRAIGRRFVAIQAMIHGIDWRAHGLGCMLTPAVREGEAVAAQLDFWGQLYARSALIEVPLLRYALGWLRANMACSGALVLCHGDYRIGNFMVRGGEIVAIFDWELAHVSDPIEDIAYSGLPLFRGRRHTRALLSQLLPAEEYFELYESHTGQAVDPAIYRFWSVLGLVKAASVHLAAARAFEEGRTHDLRLAALGHQVHYALRLLAAELDLGR
jgi:aminoglycoside phosphotransferase (APT) family kinase protein